MKHLSKPTAKLPLGRLVVNEAELGGVVDAVNANVDAISALSRELEGEEADRKSLAERVSKLESAVAKIASAIDALLGGNQE